MKKPLNDKHAFKKCKRCGCKNLENERICINCMEEFTPEADIDFNEGRM
jgi:hypothetical protein